MLTIKFPPLPVAVDSAAAVNLLGVPAAEIPMISISLAVIIKSPAFPSPDVLVVISAPS